MKSKNVIATAAVLLTGWLVASHANGLQNRYSEDVSDFQATQAGDSLPTQARVAHSHAQVMIELNKIVAKVAPEAAVNAASDVATFKIDDRATVVERLLSTAFRFLGVRYRSGQSGPNGFDCSGFTSYVYKQNNMQITRSSRTQYAEGLPVAGVSEMKKGDLVFFGGARGGRSVGHVGIVTEVDREAGNFKFIHASISSGIRVDNSSDPYYSRRYVGARRIIQ